MHLIFWLFPLNILGLKSVSKNTYPHVQAPWQLRGSSLLWLFASTHMLSRAPLRCRFLSPSWGPSLAASLSRRLVSSRLAWTCALSLPGSCLCWLFPASTALPAPSPTPHSSKRLALGIQLPPSHTDWAALRVVGLMGREMPITFDIVFIKSEHFLELTYTPWQHVAGGRNDLF